MSIFNAIALNRRGKPDRTMRLGLAADTEVPRVKGGPGNSGGTATRLSVTPKWMIFRRSPVVGAALVKQVHV
jgi:hypothetical protein